MEVASFAAVVACGLLWDAGGGGMAAALESEPDGGGSGDYRRRGRVRRSGARPRDADSSQDLAGCAPSETSRSADAGR
ncbi:hypothetical protein IMZ48_30830 [Candidatus Bathyarchaeota archaeon]|nr:hypothetical protein [Candidatus Bathyarchaeota archaeon]